MRHICVNCMKSIDESPNEVSARVGGGFWHQVRCEACHQKTHCLDTRGALDDYLDPASSHQRKLVMSAEVARIDEKCSDSFYELWLVERTPRQRDTPIAFTNELSKVGHGWQTACVKSPAPLSFDHLYSWHELRQWVVYVEGRRMPKLKKRRDPEFGSEFMELVR